MLFRNILFFCVLILAFQVFSQEPKEIKKANKAFQDENYIEAVKLTMYAFEKVNPKSRKAPAKTKQIVVCKLSEPEYQVYPAKSRKMTANSSPKLRSEGSFAPKAVAPC